MDKRVVELWLGLCDRDLKGAHGMLETKNYVLAGFQCQQVIEKALKAYIASVAEDDPPRIHNTDQIGKLERVRRGIFGGTVETYRQPEPALHRGKVRRL